MTDEEKKITKRLKDDIALVTFNDNLNYGIGNLYVNINDLKIILNLISKLQEIIKNQSYTNKKMRNKIKTVRKERNKLQADIELKNETISKAIGHIEACKTSMGNYILSPNETEYLLEILKGETENDTENK